MKKPLTSALALIILLVAGAGSAGAGVNDGFLALDDPGKMYELTGTWKFMPADRPEYARRDFDDSSWGPIRVPGGWHIQGHDYDGTAWFRMKFTVSGGLAGRNLRIITPYIDHAAEIYLNGTLVGGRGRISADGKLLESNSRNSVYWLRGDLIDVNGPNTLAFRVAGKAGIGGFAFAYFRIGEAELIQDSFYRYVISISFISSIFIFMGLYHLLLYSWRKKEKHYLSFGILAILTGLQQMAIKTVGFWIIDDNWVNLYVNTFVLASYPLFIMDFMQKFTGLKVAWIYRTGKWVSIALVAALTIIFAGLWLGGDIWSRLYGLYWKHAVPSMLLSIFVFMIYCLYLCFVAARKGELSAKILIYGIAIYLFSMILGMLSYFSVISLDIMFEYGFLGMIVSMVVALAHKFSLVHNEADRLNEELASKNRDLMKIDRMKDDFLANTSHELRTPLNGIIGIAESLAERAGAAREGSQLENINLIISSAKRLSNLVNDILDFSKLKNRDITLNQRPIDLRQVTEIVISVSRALSAGKKLEIVNAISEDSPWVLADENRIQQILYNLIGNAIKFTDSGSITISASFAPPYISGNGMVTVSVADTGIGIPEDRYDDVFKSFEQLEGSISREYGGTGLGLSITRQLVELHGGNIWLKSKLGEGTTFYFTLMAAYQPSGEELRDSDSSIKRYIAPSTVPAAGDDLLSAGDTVPSVSVSNGITILAVDDELINLQVIRNLLGDRGYTTIVAHNGFEALKALDCNVRPDLVLLDIMMPRMSGYEVCRKIRERFALCSLPVLMLTAKNQVEDIVTSLEMGANDYIMKPFDRKELMARINTLVTLKRAVEQQEKLASIQNEISIARDILMNALPGASPRDPHFDISVKYLPMERIGGDYYDFNTVREGFLGIILADVTGHGIPAAIVAGMVKTAFNVQRAISADCGSLISGIHRTLKESARHTLLTAGYLEIEIATGVLSYARAGHLPLYIYRRSEDRIIELRPPGRIMGWKCDLKCEIDTVTLAGGDRIVFLTDGITEIRNDTGELFGEERLYGFMKEHAELGAGEFSRVLIDAALAWAGKTGGDDDMTLLTIDYRG